MKILEITQNDYKRNFITIIPENDSFTGSAYKCSYDYTMYAKDKSGRMHEIKVVREQECQGFNIYKPINYYDTYAVGNGNGMAMGWTLGLSKREAFKIARSIMATVQKFELVARVYISN